MENCVDVVRPFVAETGNRDIPIQILGGLGAAAVLEPGTCYDSVAREIIAPKEGLFIPRQRENGSPRDMDVLVLSTDEDLIKETEAIAAETVGDRLEVNVFGLHKDKELKDLQNRPFSLLAIKAALSDRYVIGGELNGAGYYKAVFPFGVVAPSEALVTWHLINGEEPPIPIPHPAMMVLNNSTRSIAGMRKKYDSKAMTMTDNMLSHDPELVDWMIDGPGKSHLALAGALRALGWKRVVREVKPLRLSMLRDITIQPPASETLVDDPTFLLREAPRSLQKRTLALARLKSAGFVGPVERHFQDFWERHNLESHFKNIVRNR